MKALPAHMAALSLLLAAACAQHGPDAPPDPFMGDWEGTLKVADGTERLIVAQVIAWGNDEYQANLLDAFDQRIEPIAVLKGKLADGKVAFDDSATIADGAFTGELTGDRTSPFTMRHVVRLSPTLSLEPPEGAVVLFDGTSLDAWRRGGREPYVVDLAREIGGDNRVAYMRSRVWLPEAQQATLLIGSDDAVKAWVNGELVHSNNTNRPVRLGDDRADIELQEGWNTVLLKISQGSGGWGGCAGVTARDGSDLDSLRFDPMPAIQEGAELIAYQGGSSGTIVTWEIAGPYQEAGKTRPELHDTLFPPEEGDEGVEWRVVNDKPQPRREWRIAENGAMEIAAGAGSMVTRQQFRDQRVHLEFRTPFRPTARGQSRGNSGVYLQGRYEVQILDSYGLEGAINECGAIYGLAPPAVNMCAPPLQWQTFDIGFRAARFDKETNTVENARMTVRHNGVLVHESVEIPAPSTGGQPVQSGPLLLQDHGNPVQFRNIWVEELGEE